MPIRSHDFRQTIEGICKIRNDTWAEKVHDRINFKTDLPAADAVYHRTCNASFRTNKNIPQRFSEPALAKKPKLGRTVDSVMNDAFLKTMHYLESNDQEQLTVPDLQSHMGVILRN